MWPVRTSIIIPAFNEEAALPSTLCELRRAQPNVDIVVIDDGSRDQTAAVAEKAGARVLRLPFNLGVGAAVRTGLRYAATNGFERAVVMDADGQHDPAGIAALLGALDDGADMVVGSRFEPGAPAYAVGRTRRGAMRLLQVVVCVRTGRRFTDLTSGFRAMDRSVIELLAAEHPVEYLADTVEALLIVHDRGLRVEEVPAAMRPRAGGVPSSRGLLLAVNYVRLLIGILSSAIFRQRVGSHNPPEAREEQK